LPILLVLAGIPLLNLKGLELGTKIEIISLVIVIMGILENLTFVPIPNIMPKM
jgi:hypothetical protein